MVDDPFMDHGDFPEGADPEAEEAYAVSGQWWRSAQKHPHPHQLPPNDPTRRNDHTATHNVHTIHNDHTHSTKLKEKGSLENHHRPRCGNFGRWTSNCPQKAESPTASLSPAKRAKSTHTINMVHEHTTSSSNHQEGWALRHHELHPTLHQPGCTAAALSFPTMRQVVPLRRRS